MTQPFPFRDPSTPLAREQSEMRKLVYKTIDADRDSFNMGAWEIKNRCRTTRCVAGWAEFYADGQVTSVGAFTRAVQVMGLTLDEYYTDDDDPQPWDGLFFTSDARAIDRMRDIAAVEPGE